MALTKITGNVLENNLEIPSVSSINDGPLAGFRNAIINGNFDIWQRGTSFAGQEYTADRWITERAGSTCTTSRQSFALGQTDVPGEPTYFCRFVVSSVTGADNSVVPNQRIEGVRTFAGQTVTLSFWAKADATKFMSIEFSQNFGTGGTPSTRIIEIGVQKFTLTTSWQKFTKTITLPSIAGKTLGTNNNDILQIYFWLDAGSNSNSRTNSLGHQSGTFDIAQVQLESGPVATPFEHRPIGTELALCQRYFELVSVTGSAPLGFGVGQCSSATAAYFQVSTFTPKRVPPVATLSAGTTFAVVSAVGNLIGGTGASILNYGLNHPTVQITVASGLTAGNSTNLYANGPGVTASISISSEL